MIELAVIKLSHEVLCLILFLFLPSLLLLDNIVVEFVNFFLELGELLFLLVVHHDFLVVDTIKASSLGLLGKHLFLFLHLHKLLLFLLFFFLPFLLFLLLNFILFELVQSFELVSLVSNIVAISLNFVEFQIVLTVVGSDVEFFLVGELILLAGSLSEPVLECIAHISG